MRRPSVLCLMAVIANAAEAVRGDVAAGIEVLPVAFDYTLRAPTGTLRGSDEFDRVLGLRMGARWSFSRPGAAGAPVVGIDGRYGEATYSSDGAYRTLGAGVSLGYVYGFSRRWAASAEALAEMGTADLNLPGSASSPAVDANGQHLVYGVKAGAIYGLSRRWYLDASIGYLDIASDLNFDRGSYRLEQRGFLFGIGVVWRISPSPSRLE